MARKADNQITRMDSDLSPTDVSSILGKVEAFRTLPKAITDDQVEERINYFFRWCAEHQARPGIELLALCLGYSRQTLFHWSRGVGCSERRKMLIQDARQALSAFLEVAGMEGKINPVTLIFWQKANYNYVESTVLEVRRPEDEALLQAQQTPEQIEKAIEADIPLD